MFPNYGAKGSKTEMMAFDLDVGFGKDWTSMEEVREFSISRG